MSFVLARPLMYLLPTGIAVLLAACGGGAAPVASSLPPPSMASAVAKPASASAAASPAAVASAFVAAKPSAAASEATKPSAPASAALTGPAAVAVRYFDLVNRGDTSAVAALFTDDAVFVGIAPCAITTFCKGTAAIAKRVEAAAALHTKLTLVGTPQVAGNLVFLRFEARSDSVQKAGLERRLDMSNVVVLGDKIGAFAAQDDFSDAQTLKFTISQQQAQASASAAASPAAKTDPAAVVQRYIDAVHRGDANAAAAVFADTAVNISGSCAPRAPCTTPADISKQIQIVIAGHTKVTLGDPLVAGNAVQFHTEVRNDAATAAGVGSFRAFDTWTVAGDRAVGRINQQDLNDAQTLKFAISQQPAQASASAVAKPAASVGASAKPAG